MMKKLLMVIDYQNDFVCGALGFAQAKKLEAPIGARIEAYRREGQDVLFTFDTHGGDYLETQEGKKLPLPHCIVDTAGWQLYGKIRSLYQDDMPVFYKPTFGSLALGNYLKDKAYDQIELVGVVTNMCVIANAVIAKAALPEAEIIINTACVASSDEALHQKALEVMAGMQMTLKAI